MSKKYDIAVIGGDLRQVYMVNEFIFKGYSVIVFGISHYLISKQAKKADSLSESLSESDTIICPVPFTKNQIDITNISEFNDITVDSFINNLKENTTLFGGNIPKNVLSYCNDHNIKCHDLMEMNSVAILNAIATAEGTIAEAIIKSPINLHQSDCLILGYGRCAKILAKKLSAMDANVCIAARNADARAEAEAFGYLSIALDYIDDALAGFDFVFNTIPSLVLTKSKLDKMSKDVTIIDIASSFGGVDFNAAKTADINASLCLGLPGKYSPKTSGEILTKAIENIIIEGSD